MIIEKSEISEKLKQLKQIGSPKVVDKPQGVLLKDNCLKANNLQIAMTVPLSVKTDEAFVIPMNAISLIESLPSGSIEIKGTDKSVTVSCGKIKSKFPTFAVADFTEPQAISADTEPAFTLPFIDIADGIESIMYACPAEHSKPVLKGVFFDGNGEHLNLVTSDGLRMAIALIKSPQKVSVVVPRDAVRTMLAIGGKDDDIVFYTEDKRCIANVGDYTIYALLCNEPYPNYRALFPKDEKYALGCSKKDLLEMLNRCLVCQAAEKTKAFTLLKCNQNDSKLMCLLFNGTNTFEESIGCDINEDKSKGTEMRIGVNTKYLYEAVKASDENIGLQYYGIEKPLVVSDNMRIQLVMPLRLTEAALKV